ncbi:MAG: DNA repair protein RecO [Bacteroidetes bacterium]|jgi:DNA repair protein RecO (recombination protein O)|nr:DNA repair protein RecO [Bacteroidota bacterium]
MIVKTSAIVLRTIRYGDTSKIVTLFTRDHGKVAVVAKGARSARARFGSALDAGAHLEVVYHARVSREVQTLTQADVLERHRRLSSSLAATTAMMQMVEVVNVLTQPGEPHQDLYELLAAGLRAADRRDDGLADVLIAFRWKTIGALGFEPSFVRCVRCAKEVIPGEPTRLRYHVGKGGPLCSECEQAVISLPSRAGGRDHWSETLVSTEALEGLQRLQSGPLVDAGSRPVSNEVRNEMESVLRLYERFHLEQRTPLRTSDLVREVIRSH